MRKTRTTEGERKLNFMGPRRTCNDGMSGAGDWVIWSGAINRGNRGTTPARQHRAHRHPSLPTTGKPGALGPGAPGDPVNGPALAGSYARTLPLPDDEVGVFRMSFEIGGDGRADHIDFHPMLARPLECRFGQGRGHAFSA